ncbi:hypothetical protein JYB64_06525 [Algoriphagus aestuarii]|nr:hypothetical protein [Algoriphagus aestuarii]
MKYFSPKIRLYSLHSLIFFVLVFLHSCSQNQEDQLNIVWENEKAVGLQIPKDISIDNLEIRLVQDEERTSMLGRFEETNNGMIFKPLIPFTRGLSYELVSGDKQLGQILIPFPDMGDAYPELIAAYPSQDTVPENLLKVYLTFSQPMKEGVALNYLTLLNSNRDTVPGVFLNLQPELWNESRTQLTVWLDPGRIKRDLIPNLEMGAPLKNNQRYELLVSDGWKAQNGLELGARVSKSFIVIQRDSISPNPDQWLITTPKTNSRDQLKVDFLEALDYSLLQEVFTIKNEDGKNIPGVWELGFEEKAIAFSPDENWKTGNYTILIEIRLEDLAGNNINRLFEVDLEQPNQTKTNDGFYKLNFSIKE